MAIAALRWMNKSIVVALVIGLLRASEAHIIKQDKKSNWYYETNNHRAHEKTEHAIQALLKVVRIV
jgi:hypothetical protein